MQNKIIKNRGIIEVISIKYWKVFFFFFNRWIIDEFYLNRWSKQEFSLYWKYIVDLTLDTYSSI